MEKPDYLKTIASQAVQRQRADLGIPDDGTKKEVQKKQVEPGEPVAGVSGDLKTADLEVNQGKPDISKQEAKPTEKKSVELLYKLPKKGEEPEWRKPSDKFLEKQKEEQKEIKKIDARFRGLEKIVEKLEKTKSEDVFQNKEPEAQQEFRDLEEVVSRLSEDTAKRFQDLYFQLSKRFFVAQDKFRVPPKKPEKVAVESQPEVTQAPEKPEAKESPELEKYNKAREALKQAKADPKKNGGGSITGNDPLAQAESNLRVSRKELLAKQPELFEFLRADIILDKLDEKDEKESKFRKGMKKVRRFWDRRSKTTKLIVGASIVGAAVYASGGLTAIAGSYVGRKALGRAIVWTGLGGGAIGIGGYELMGGIGKAWSERNIRKRLEKLENKNKLSVEDRLRQIEEDMQQIISGAYISGARDMPENQESN